MIVQKISHTEAQTWFLNASLAKELLYFQSLHQPDSDVTLTVIQSGETTPQVVRFAMMPPEVLPVYPTQIMSFFGAISLCGVVLFLERFGKRDGYVSMLFLFLYSTGRFCVEFFRDDEGSFMHTGMSIAQNVSIVIFTLGIVTAIYIFTRPPQHFLATRFPVVQENAVEPKEPSPKKRGKSGRK